MGVLVLALIGANFGLTWAVVAASQQTTVSGDVPVMVVKGTDVPVQTASHEFMVAADGSLQMRNSSGGPSVIQTSVATQQMPLSSALPDEAFFELKTVGLVSPTGVSMHLTVLGFMREPSLTGLDTVTLITHIGRVILVGTELSYMDDTQAALFSQAGFMISASSGRRLLQVRQLFGIFNAISSLSKNTSYSVPAPSLPDQFVMFARRRSPCIPWPLNSTNETAAPVTWTGGALPISQGLDYCALLNISSEFTVDMLDPTSGAVVARYATMTYTMYRMGSTQLRVEYTHPFVPGTMLVEVLDNSDPAAPIQFSYQVSDVDRGLGLVSSSVMAEYINASSPDIFNVTVSGDAPFLVGPVSYYNPVNVTTQDLVGDMLGASMDYLGDTDINGEAVRIWALHLNNNSFHAYWYDSVANETVRRIAFDGVGELDVLRIVPLTGQASVNAYLFTPPVPGITLAMDDSGDTPVQLPPKLSLDPFLPFKRAAEMRIPTATPPTPASRRLLRQAQITSPTFVRRNLHGLVDNLNEFGPAKTAGGRGLMQAFPRTCAANNLCSVNPSTVGSMNSFIPASPGQQPLTPSVVSFGYGPLFSFTNGPVGNGSRPCYYSLTDNYGASIGWPAPNPLFPTLCPPVDCGPLTISVSGGITLQFGADLSCITSVAGTVSLTLGMGLPAIAKILGSATFNPLSWNLLSITVGVYTNPITETCAAPTNSAISINMNDPATAALLGPLTSVYGNAAAGAVCRCLAANTMSTQVGFVVAGPDIPGIVLSPVLAVVPGLNLLTPLLYVRALRLCRERGATDCLRPPRSPRTAHEVHDHHDVSVGALPVWHYPEPDGPCHRFHD